MRPDKKIRLVIDLVPHADTYRARRIRNPELTKLLDPRWWNKAIFGEPGGRDPMPMVVDVVEVDPSDDSSPAPAPDDTDNQPTLPFDEDPEHQTQTEPNTMFHQYTKMPEVLIAMAEGASLDTNEKPARLTGSNEPVHGKTVNAMFERKLLKGPNKAGIADLTAAGKKAAAELLETA